jgi:phosphoribosylanthranilate isomerase
MTAGLRDTLSPFDALDRTAGPVVKTCGIMQLEHALAAAEFGADMVGMVFAPSRRAISVEFAASVRAAFDCLERKPLLVGVFVNESPEKVLAVADAAGLDVVQLSGDETPTQLAQCASRYLVIKAFRFAVGTSSEAAQRELQRYRALVPLSRLRFLVDAFHAGEYGGTGHLSDWELARALAQNEPVLLAGGLNPRNVSQAVRAVAPWGTDVSSGIELVGVKDQGLIQSFIAQAKSST